MFIVSLSGARREPVAWRPVPEELRELARPARRPARRPVLRELAARPAWHPRPEQLRELVLRPAQLPPEQPPELVRPVQRPELKQWQEPARRLGPCSTDDLSEA